MRLSALAAAILTLAACGKAAAPAGPAGPPPTAVLAAQPIVRDLPVERSAIGRVEAAQRIDIMPQVSGAITRLLVADGAAVAADQPLIEIDSATYRAALARAEAAIAQARAQAVLAKLERDRVQDLRSRDNASQRELDAAEAALKAADAALAAAEAGAVTARIDLERCVIKAPFAGRLGDIPFAAGEIVQGGGPVPPTRITTLVSEDPVEIAFDLDEAGWRLAGDRLRAAVSGGPAVPVRVGTEGEQGFPHDGTVIAIGNEIDARSATVRLRARVANPSRALTPGAFARVQLAVGAAAPRVLIHEQAIMANPQGRYAFVVTPGAEGAPPVALPRPLVLGAQVGSLRIVEQGLTPEDRVVVVGQARIFFPGAPLAPAPADMATLAPAAPATTAPVK